MSKPRLLVAEDKDTMRALLVRLLGETCVVDEAIDGDEAVRLVTTESYDVVLTDIRMPGRDGFAVLEAVKKRSPDTEVIMLTAFASLDRAVEAIKLGAYDYLAKPFEPDELALVVARAVERRRLRAEAASLKRVISESRGFQRMLGRSAAMHEVFEQLQRAAATDITVLLTGETGTGKELAARAVHATSARAGAAFVAVNAGALPAELVESELFGAARGAYTGATARRGLFEEAEGGTLFLDEVAELPLAAQVKLNRALQEREIRRLGEATSVRVDVRVIAATHRDLKAEVQAGRFREDLYYRLWVFPIRTPPLRERKDDIPLLAGHFLEHHALLQRRRVEAFEPDALRALIGHAWPGNVRELENAVERAVAVAPEARIRLVDLPLEVRGPEDAPVPPETLISMPFREAVEQARDRVSRQYLVALMRELRGNVTRAAERAGMERESMHRLLRRYGVRSDDFKRDE